MSQLNSVLDRKLAVKTAELDAEYARRREEERTLVQAKERQRIMADIHDGVGARLLALAVDAQEEDRPARALIPDIHDTVDELRLIVNALDAVGDDLVAALAGFRRTVEPKMKKAVFTPDWRVDRTVKLDGLETAITLQLYRILQEACANAIRHLGGDRVRIALAHKGPCAVLSIADNGDGGVRIGAAGFGMMTIADRARRIGAELDVGASDLGGVEVRLTFFS